MTTIQPKNQGTHSELGEHALFLTSNGAIMELTPLTAASFSCHLQDIPAKSAFLRIYQQSPVSGTEFIKSTIRARQATSPEKYSKLEWLKFLRNLDCDFTPALPQRDDERTYTY